MQDLFFIPPLLLLILFLTGLQNDFVFQKHPNYSISHPNLAPSASLKLLEKKDRGHPNIVCVLGAWHLVMATVRIQ